MKKFFIHFDRDDDNISSILHFLKDRGTIHNILDTLYCFISSSYDTTLDLRDAILELSEDSRMIVVEIPEGVNSAWHLSVENSNWLKSVLNGR